MPIGTLRALAVPLRCATCHGELDAAPFVCARCGTKLHEDCRAELDACPTLGCHPGPRPVAVPPWLRPAPWVSAAVVGLGLVLAAVVVFARARPECTWGHAGCVHEALAAATLLGVPGSFLVLAAAIGLPVVLEPGA